MTHPKSENGALDKPCLFINGQCTKYVPWTQSWTSLSHCGQISPEIRILVLQANRFAKVACREVEKTPQTTASLQSSKAKHSCRISDDFQKKIIFNYLKQSISLAWTKQSVVRAFIVWPWLARINKSPSASRTLAAGNTSWTQQGYGESGESREVEDCLFC